MSWIDGTEAKRINNLKNEKMKNLLIIFLLTHSCFSLFGQAEIDTKNLINGNASVYRSFNHSKAKGLDFSIKYLNNWIKAEGNRPNIVQKFTKDVGNKQVSYLVLILKVDGPPFTSEEIESELGNAHLSIPKSAQFISKSGKLKIDGEPAYSVEFKGSRGPEENVSNIGITTYTIGYNVFYKNYLVQIQCSVSGSSNESDLLDTFNQYKQFFALVVNSFIIQSKWK